MEFGSHLFRGTFLPVPNIFAISLWASQNTTAHKRHLGRPRFTGSCIRAVPEEEPREPKADFCLLGMLLYTLNFLLSACAVSTATFLAPGSLALLDAHVSD